MLEIVTITSYVFAAISFALFVYFVIRGKTEAEPSPTPQTLGDAQPQGAIADTAELLKALAQLSDSFSKAGRTVMCLVSAIFFLLVAAIGAGLDNLAVAIGA